MPSPALRGWAAGALLVAALGLAVAFGLNRPASDHVTPRTLEAPMTRPAQRTGTSLRQRLTPLQYRVTQEGATEPPFANAYWDNHREGLYVDVVDGRPLFSSRDKFDSGCGWPSFARPIETGAVLERTDSSHGMIRQETRAEASGSHLGHVFDDGPPELGGLRYCINSAALRFIPVDDLAREGYGQYLPLFGMAAPPLPRVEEATLAGGCFWGMQELLRQQPGVLSTEVGYTGGRRPNPTYEAHEGHAEAVLVRFDPARTNYEAILRFFFRMHDPTTPGRQGNDIGASYRSAIFYHGEAQRTTAERMKTLAAAAWKRPVVTEIQPAGPWWKAEEEHQDYLQKNPGGYTCHYARNLDL